LAAVEIREENIRSSTATRIMIGSETSPGVELVREWSAVGS
jgi:hypothetical protein